jgi:alanine racemase
VRRLAPRSEVLAVVKANAYGHGAIELTRTLQQLAVHRFGVATVDEGIALRQAGIQDPILVMGPTVPAQFPDLIAHRLTPVLYRADMIQTFAACPNPPNRALLRAYQNRDRHGSLGRVLQNDLPDLAAMPELSRHSPARRPHDTSG